jgi:hypothetical protein
VASDGAGEDRAGVRVESKYIPLTLIFSPWEEEMRRYNKGDCGLSLIENVALLPWF